MKAVLQYRHAGKYAEVAECSLPGRRYIARIRSGASSGRKHDFTVYERALLRDLPQGFLPVDPSEVMLAVEGSSGPVGVQEPTQFLRWTRFLNAYCLEIRR